ncbi:GspH/FimT family pseudopilin [Croceicoccus naphthovorans]|uniref:GspH/FimT family pseudopilin n=1 Tax=Croceicoccus naphthovorans TaxID=1348774 RepID=UPI0009E1C2A1|nr:GspH/FimT family pseudopilin [Croceicoccus naphthovorans]MBB3988806.1 general secretion pathway protein H [Croceicoccus naphthovorans]
MPRLTGPARPRNGFSLIELMVVLFIVALMTGIALMTLPDGRADLRREAERFAARTIAARDQAITTSASVSAVVGPAGYYYERRVDGRWLPLDGRALEATDWERGTVAAFEGKGADEGDSANRRILFDPLGLASEDARIVLSHDGNAVVVVLRRNGEIAVTAP